MVDTVRPIFRYLYRGLKRGKPVFGTIFAPDFAGVVERLSEWQVEPIKVMCHQGDIPELVRQQGNHFLDQQSFYEEEARLIAEGRLIDVSPSPDPQ